MTVPRPQSFPLRYSSTEKHTKKKNKTKNNKFSWFMSNEYCRICIGQTLSTLLRYHGGPEVIRSYVISSLIFQRDDGEQRQLIDEGWKLADLLIVTGKSRILCTFKTIRTYVYLSLFTSHLSVFIIYNFPISSMYSTSFTEIVLKWYTYNETNNWQIHEEKNFRRSFNLHLSCWNSQFCRYRCWIHTSFIYSWCVCARARTCVLFSLIVFGDERKNRIHRWNEFLVKLFFQLLPHIYRLQTHIRMYPLSHTLWQLEILPYSIRSVDREMVNIRKLVAFHAFHFRTNDINPKKDSTSVK